MIEQETIRQMPSRRVGLVLLAMAVVASLLLAPAAKPAQAAFPGQNGKIVFERAQVGVKAEIFTMNPDGTGQTNLTNDPANDNRPAVSPDGKKIVFESRSLSIGLQIFVMNPDGSNETPIPSHAPFNGTVDRDPEWAVAS